MRAENGRGKLKINDILKAACLGRNAAFRREGHVRRSYQYLRYMKEECED